MRINIQKVAMLANLTLAPEEEAEFDGQLNGILEYIEKLNSIDTSSVEPTAQVTGLKNVIRNDEVGNNMIDQNEALSGAEKTHNGMFIVDKLVETNE